MFVSLFRLPLSEILCNGVHPQHCDPLEGVFNYMYDWEGGECGSVDGSWCAWGREYTAGSKPEETYYGYCAKQVA